MKNGKLLAGIFLTALIIGMIPAVQPSGAHFEYILATGTIPPWHFENGTEIPFPCDDYFAYIIVSSIEGEYYRYNPELETLELNFSGIWIDPTPMNDTNGDEYTVHGYATFYAAISQNFSRPHKIAEKMDNGTIIELPFKIEEKYYDLAQGEIVSYETSIPIWYVEFTVYFSNPLVTIYGERPTAKLLIAIGLVLAALIVSLYYYKKRLYKSAEKQR